MLPLLCLLSLPSLAAPVRLVYRPTGDAGPRYNARLQAALDYPLGKGVPVSADVVMGCFPGPRTPEGTYPCFMFIEDGVFRVLGEAWNFADQTISWQWELSERREIVSSTGETTGLLALVELCFRFVYVAQLPTDEADIGHEWTTESLQEIGESSVSLNATHRLVSLEATEGATGTATIESTLQIPVDVTFVGTRFAGTFTGQATTRVDIATGEIEAVDVHGEASLENPGGSLNLTLRDISVSMERSGNVTRVDASEWKELAEQRHGIGGSSFIDAVLNANVSKYLHDEWHIFYPRFGSTAVDGTMLGAGVVGRHSGDYLYELDAMYGSGSRRALTAFSITRGYPVQPRNQQFVSVSNLGGGERIEFGATHYSGRQLGSTGIGRLRWGLSGTLAELVPSPPSITTSGRVSYLTASLTRFRTGASAVGYHSLDWEAVLAASVGGRGLGGTYDFTRLQGTVYGFYHLDANHTWAARLQMTAGFGQLPYQYRTSLVNRGILRGFGLGDASLVRHSVAGSLEYRFRIDTPPYFDELGLRDWWGAVFVDAGVGADSYEGFLRSRLYADVGVTGRARVKYLGVPIYVWASLAWPVSGRSGGPRVTLGLDWAF